MAALLGACSRAPTPAFELLGKGSVAPRTRLCKALPAEHSSDGCVETPPLFCVTSRDNADRFGDTLCVLPDQDDDGIADIAVAAADVGRAVPITPILTGETFKQGYVAILSGKNGREIGGLRAESFGSRHILRVQSLEDLNGDGAREWAVCVDDWSWTGMLSNDSHVVVNDGATRVRLFSIGGKGEALACAIDDRDADGFRDVAIARKHEETDVVRLRVVAGDDGSDLESLELKALQGAVALIAIGDIDRDGIADLALSVHRESSSAGARGAVALLSGATLKPLVVLTGDENEHHFGRSLCGGFDWNTDGVCDLGVGIPRATASGNARGAFAIVALPSGERLATLLAPADLHSFGNRACLLDSGATSGRPLFAIGAMDVDRGVVIVFEGAERVCWLPGVAVACLGDLGGDGKTDIAWVRRVGKASAITGIVEVRQAEFQSR